VSTRHAKAHKIAIVSGKGGVGKTVITANLAASLAAEGRRTLVIDADLGLANMDVILGIQSRYSILDVLQGVSLDDALVSVPGSFDLLPAASGRTEGTFLSLGLSEGLKPILEELESRYEFIFFDVGAGIGDVVTFFAGQADEIVLIVTPDPTSLVDAYATVKVLSQIYCRSEFCLIVNQVDPTRPGQGSAIAGRLQSTVARFLCHGGNPVRLHMIGSIPSDPTVPQAIGRHKLLRDCNSPSARLIRQMTGPLVSKALKSSQFAVRSSQ
jgi:flagellar biosynthesis protein FlhG